MAQFKGVRKLSEKKYNELKKDGKIDDGILYVTPSSINNGGGDKKYLHRITCYASGDWKFMNVRFEIRNETSTPYTTLDEIKQAIIDSGATSSETSLIANGFYSASWVSGIFVNSAGIGVLYNTFSKGSKDLYIDNEKVSVTTSLNRSQGGEYAAYFGTIVPLIKDTVIEI